MLDTLVRHGEATDRRLGYLLAAGAFFVAFAGGRLGPDRSVSSLQSMLVGWAGLLGAGAVLAALRGTSRRADVLLTRDPVVGDVEQALSVLERKSGYGWIASRLLLGAVVLLSIGAAVYAAGGG
jgi:hypothetical protein